MEATSLEEKEKAMIFTPAHVAVTHHPECNLFENRKSIEKLDHVEMYLKLARMTCPSEYSSGYKKALLIVMDASISFGDCTSTLCHYHKIGGKVRLSA